MEQERAIQPEPGIVYYVVETYNRYGSVISSDSLFILKALVLPPRDEKGQEAYKKIKQEELSAFELWKKQNRY